MGVDADRVETQEFYCRHCDENDKTKEAGGYFTVRLHVGWNRHIYLHCPNCNAKHYRTVKDGQITEGASLVDLDRNQKEEEVFVPKSAWSKEPRTTAMAKARRELEEKKGSLYQIKQLREGATIRENRDIIDQSWVDRFILREQEES